MKFQNFESSPGVTVAIPLPESYRDCFELIRSDLFRLSGRRKSTAAILGRFLTHPFSWQLWLRMASYRGWLSLPCRAMAKLCKAWAKVDIPSTCKIGYGLYVGHGFCIVVNGLTAVGNNVNISQFVNIGTNHRTPAVIGNNVYLGPSVCVVEDVQIGNDVTVGAGAVVVRSLPPGSSCVGVPAKPVSFDAPGRYVVNRWPLPQ